MASSSTPLACSSLTEDILIEIFTYLPLNSIYKFKCLSKVWLSNLSNPYFMTKWYQINENSLPWIHYHMFCDDEDIRFRYAYPELHSRFMDRNEHLFSFQFLVNEKSFQGAKVHAVSSSNGLVLCYSTSSTHQKRYHVCNPLTHKWVSLPSPPFETGLYDVNGIFCEYSSSFASCYKVVHIDMFATPSKKLNVDVFCSVLGVWETFEVSSDENVEWGDFSLKNAVILNRTLFWIEGGNRLLVYNLNQNNGSDGHRCSLINLPEFEEGEVNRIIGESEGRVCYAKIRIAERKMTVSLWVLDEVNWKILHKDVLVGGTLEEIYSQSKDDDTEIIQVLSFSPANLNVVLLGFEHRVWAFNLQTRSFEELCLFTRKSFSDDDKSAMFLRFVLKPMPTVLPAPSWVVCTQK